MHATGSFVEKSRSFRDRIDAQLHEYCQFGDRYPQVLAEAIRHSLLAPGKRLRPMLTLMAAEACGSPSDPAIPAACAV